MTSFLRFSKLRKRKTITDGPVCGYLQTHGPDLKALVPDASVLLAARYYLVQVGTNIMSKH